MIDHLSIGVADLARSKAFYDAALAPLGYACLAEMEDACGYGRPEEEKSGIGAHALAFWIGLAPALRAPLDGHVSFRAPSREAVDAFHCAALAAGARDNGAPGLRPHYHPNYYAAFVVDPEGYRLEAVTHESQ
jgi:catechol 2,3-dioxygenase-like lactoylglutathione lyase family enzyme